MAGIDTPNSLAADMLEAAGEAIVGTRAIVQKGSLNIKNGARKNVAQSAPTHNAHAQYAITFDTKVSRTTVSGEIGYDKDINGGALGNLLEFGGGGDRSPAHRDIGRAFDSELPRFEDALALFATKLL